MSYKTKILIVEHAPTDIELIKHELSAAGIACISETVQNEKEYIAALHNFLPNIILSDFTFPSFDGMTAFRIKQSICPETPFIFVSGTIGEEKSIELIKTGVTDYALKENLSNLPLKVKRALKEAEEKYEKKKTADALGRALEEVNKHAKELARSNAELEQFAYVASHDLQEPLRMVTSFLTLLENKYEGVIDAKGKAYIGFAVDGAKRMRVIIRDLLEFSRVGRTEELMESLDLNELVRDIKILFRREIGEKNASIDVDKLPVIHTFKAPMRQVFQNLIGNALKYSRTDIPPRITIEATDFNEHWEFSFADNGIGIDSEYFDKIFIIFQRLHAKDEYPGTGMGLAVTKKIIENSGGRIWLTSAKGKGSVFHFTFPKATFSVL